MYQIVTRIDKPEAVQLPPRLKEEGERRREGDLLERPNLVMSVLKEEDTGTRSRSSAAMIDATAAVQ